VSADTLTRDRSSRAARSAQAAERIDPRLRARRDEVARDQRGRRIRRLLVALAVLAVVVAAVGATQSSLLDVDAITVRGTTRTPAVQVRSASGITRGLPLISVDLGAAARRIERLPWVRSAKVTRSWSGSVAITVAERHPVAIVGHGSDAALVDADAHVLSRSKGSQGLPVVRGEAGTPGSTLGPRTQMLVSIVAGLPGRLRSQVAGARTSPRGAILTLTDGIVVRWGEDTDSGAKAGALRALLRQADRETIATIDVTVPTAAALTRRNP
jgi:cell division protein FtsQ